MPIHRNDVALTSVRRRFKVMCPLDKQLNTDRIIQYDSADSLYFFRKGGKECVGYGCRKSKGSSRYKWPLTSVLSINRNKSSVISENIRKNATQHAL